LVEVQVEMVEGTVEAAQERDLVMAELELNRIHKFLDNSSSAMPCTCCLCNGSCNQHIDVCLRMLLLLSLLVAVVLGAGVDPVRAV
jgi:hypothetical protein